MRCQLAAGPCEPRRGAQPGRQGGQQPPQCIWQTLVVVGCTGYTVCLECTTDLSSDRPDGALVKPAGSCSYQWCWYGQQSHEQWVHGMHNSCRQCTAGNVHHHCCGCCWHLCCVCRYVWELGVPFDELAGAPEVRCRACDSAMNSQPERCAACG